MVTLRDKRNTHCQLRIWGLLIASAVNVSCSMSFVPSLPMTVYPVKLVDVPISKDAVMHEREIPSGVAQDESGRFVSQPSMNSKRELIPLQDFLVAKVHDGEISAIALVNDGSVCVSAGFDGKVVVTTLNDSTLKTGRGKKLLPNKNKSRLFSQVILSSSKPVLSIALSSSGRYLAIAWFSYLVIYDFYSGNVISELTRLDGRITSLQFEPREELVLIGMASGDLFGWTFKEGAAANQMNALESYLSATSPVVRILAHPAGRSFFAIEGSGGGAFWRFLRAEKEMGLRDNYALVDQLSQGLTKEDFSLPNVRFLDAVLDRGGSRLFISAEDGRIYKWKVRGLKPEVPIEVSNEAVGSLSLISLPDASSSEVIVSSSRDQTIKLWCPNGALLAQSELFGEPISSIRGGSTSAILWGAQKKGNLLATNFSRGEAKNILLKMAGELCDTEASSHSKRALPSG